MTIPQYILDKTKTKLEWKDYFNSEYVLHSLNNNITSTPLNSNNNSLATKPCQHNNCASFKLVHISKASSFSYLHKTTAQQPLVINHFHVELNTTHHKQMLSNELYLNTNDNERNEHVVSTHSNSNTISKRKVLKYEDFTEIFKTPLTDRDYRIVMELDDSNGNKSNDEITSKRVVTKYKKFNNYYNQLHKAKEESRKKLFNVHYSHRKRLHLNGMLK